MMRLVEFFSKDAVPCELGESIGMEVETQFLDASGEPIIVETSQRIIKELVSGYGWGVAKTKGSLTTEVVSPDGDRVLYELGRHNIELSTIPLPQNQLIAYARERLRLLYDVAAQHGAMPMFEPVFETDQSLLVIPDERDAIWLELDGKEALKLLARCSAVQFTVDVAPTEAIRYINLLGASIDRFLSDYPQEQLWRRYIAGSRADYDPLRYGGPLNFLDLNDYCLQLTRHKVVAGPRLVPFLEVQNLDISLFLRSIWWYFRLKRYGRKLCIEVRPLARRNDELLETQLQLVMDILT